MTYNSTIVKTYWKGDTCMNKKFLLGVFLVVLMLVTISFAVSANFQKIELFENKVSPLFKRQVDGAVEKEVNNVESRYVGFGSKILFIPFFKNMQCSSIQEVLGRKVSPQTTRLKKTYCPVCILN